jgi:hypothetical protein
MDVRDNVCIVTGGAQAECLQRERSMTELMARFDDDTVIIARRMAHEG